MQIVTSPTTHSELGSMERKKHSPRAKATLQSRSVGGSASGGGRAHDQSCFCLSELRKHIRDLAWNTFLIGTGVSAFTTGDMWVIPSILVLLWVSPSTCRRL